jgi:hypothetical protein
VFIFRTGGFAIIGKNSEHLHREYFQIAGGTW